MRVVEYVEIEARLRPNVVGFRRMDMGIIPAGRGQDAAAVRGIGHLLADFDLAPIDRGNGGSLYQAGCERGGGGLEKILDGARKKGGRLPSGVCFHGAHEKRLDSVAI